MAFRDSIIFEHGLAGDDLHFLDAPVPLASPAVGPPVSQPTNEKKLVAMASNSGFILLRRLELLNLNYNELRIRRFNLLWMRTFLLQGLSF